MRLLIYRRGPLLNSIGGMEKMIVLLANAMAERGHVVELLANSDKSGELKYPLHEAVTLSNLRYEKLPKLQRTLSGLMRSLPSGDRLLRQIDLLNPWAYRHHALAEHIAKSKPDVIVATSPVEMADLCYSTKPDAPIVLSFHMFPQFYFDQDKAISTETPTARERQNWSINREFVNNAAYAQVLFESFSQTLSQYYYGRVASIPNVVEQLPEDMHARHINKKHYSIAYIARLEDGKQQHRLIKAFATIAKLHPNWSLDLWGSAGKQSYEDQLKQQITQLGLGDQVHLKGHCHDLFQAYAKADVCAYPSRHEGFGLSLAEALSVGLPAVAFRTAEGVNQLISDGQNGLLADDEDRAYADALHQLMSSTELRKNMGAEAVKSIQRFAPDNVWPAWEALLQSVVESTPRRQT